MKHFSKCELELLHYLKIFPKGFTRYELSLILNRRISSICARIGDLRPYLKVIGHKLDPITKVTVETIALNARGRKIMESRK